MPVHAKPDSGYRAILRKQSPQFRTLLPSPPLSLLHLSLSAFSLALCLCLSPPLSLQLQIFCNFSYFRFPSTFVNLLTLVSKFFFYVAKEKFPNFPASLRVVCQCLLSVHRGPDGWFSPLLFQEQPTHSLTYSLKPLTDNIFSISFLRCIRYLLDSWFNWRLGSKYFAPHGYRTLPL